MSGAPLAILGAGRMGRGIALAFAQGGVASVLLDIKQRSDAEFETLRAEIDQEIAQTVQSLAGIGITLPQGALTTVLPRHEAKAALASAEILFEAVPETLEAKREAFAAIADVLPRDTVVASTSSTFLSTDIAALVPEPRRCLNAHWLNPAFLIPLVELSTHAGTDPDVVARFKAFLERHGKVPVMCGPAAGYIVPRLQTTIMNEAARMVQEGVATPADIDKAVRVGFGVRYACLGVLEFVDFGGCDILHYASEYLSGALDPRFKAPDIIARHMREGKLGLKTGDGFYDWKGLDAAGYRRALLENLKAHIDLTLHAEAGPRPTSAY